MKYKLTDNELQICIFSWPIRRVPYADIVDVSEINSAWKNLGHWSENWNNCWPWKYILIEKRTGSFLGIRHMTINPKNRDKFIQEFRKKISIRVG